MVAPSAKSLFRATKPKKQVDARQFGMLGLPEQRKPDAVRDLLDYDPTPPDATTAFMYQESDYISGISDTIWEPAVGAGHMARVFEALGFKVIASDIVDRGYPGTEIKSFYDYDVAPAKVMITNPPYCEINARDGRGRWLAHAESLGLEYVAFLLSWDWPASRINGMDALHRRYPISRSYLCCWKIDFRGGGAPPQRNGWFVWDRKWRDMNVMIRLYREIPDGQGVLL